MGGLSLFLPQRDFKRIWHQNRQKKVDMGNTESYNNSNLRKREKKRSTKKQTNKQTTNYFPLHQNGWFPSELNQVPWIRSHIPATLPPDNITCRKIERQNTRRNPALKKKKKVTQKPSSKTANIQKTVILLKVLSSSVIYTKWMLWASCYWCDLPKKNNIWQMDREVFASPFALAALQCF